MSTRRKHTYRAAEDLDSALQSFGGSTPRSTTTRRKRRRVPSDVYVEKLSMASAEARFGVEPRRSRRKSVETARLLKVTEAPPNEADDAMQPKEFNEAENNIDGVRSRVSSRPDVAVRLELRAV
jgi:hypothetical protein